MERLLHFNAAIYIPTEHFGLMGNFSEFPIICNRQSGQVRFNSLNPSILSGLLRFCADVRQLRCFPLHIVYIPAEHFGLMKNFSEFPQIKIV